MNTEVFLIVQVISHSPVPKRVQDNGRLLPTHAAYSTLGWPWAVGEGDWGVIPPSASFATLESMILNTGN